MPRGARPQLLPPEVLEVVEALGLHRCKTHRCENYVNVPRHLKRRVEELARQGWFDVFHDGEATYARPSALLMHYLSLEGK